MYAYLKNSLLLSLIFLLLSTVSTYSQTLFINEMMSSNSKFYFDEDGDDSDWIEIYNNTSSPINLLGYCLSDKAKQLEQWYFPDTTISAYGYLIVFASNKDRAISGQELHTNFAISAAGEDLFLTFDGEIVHKLPAIELQSNHSYGLFPDGSDQTYVFKNPTPGETNWYQAPIEEVRFSHRGGIYESMFVLQLENNYHNNRIYFTTDGNEPTPSSILYDGALMLSPLLHSQNNISQLVMSPPDLHKPPEFMSVPKAIIIKAAVFNSDGDRLSEIVANTYFIGELGINHNNLPIISLSANHNDLFDDHIGILVPGVNWDSNHPYNSGNFYLRGDNWEREAYVEFYEPNDIVAFRQKVGLRTHGGSARSKPQKGLKIYARSKYGMSKFNHKIFDDRATNSFNTLVLKPFSASWNSTGAEDFICNKIVRGLNVDGVASRPVILYLNGEYWGIYYISERIDPNYLETYHNVNPEQVDIISSWYGAIENGDNIDFLDLTEFVKENDLSVDDKYKQVIERIDIENFIDYQIFEIFISNHDWPVNNMRCWRSKSPESKWRFAYFDGDACIIDYLRDMFESATDTTDRDWPSNAASTLFFRKLMENDVFYNKFFLRMEEILNKYLYYHNTSVYHKFTKQFLEPEIARQMNRFSIPKTLEYWNIMMNVIHKFLSLRSCYIKSQVLERYGIELNLIECLPDNVDYGHSFGIAPNPSEGSFRIEFTPQHSGNYEFYLVNLLGQKILLSNEFLYSGIRHIAFHNIDAPTGVYHLIIQGEKENHVEKIVIRNE